MSAPLCVNDLQDQLVNGIRIATLADQFIALFVEQLDQDAAIRNAVLMDASLLTDPVEMGKIVETAVYKHVAAFYYQKATSVGYFRGGKKNKEIDIVVDYYNAGNILIEVKYREGAPISDDDAIAVLPYSIYTSPFFVVSFVCTA